MYIVSLRAVLNIWQRIDKQRFRYYTNLQRNIPFKCRQIRSGLVENSVAGENPVRYRHCMRGGTARDESQPLGQSREGSAERL